MLGNRLMSLSISKVWDNEMAWGYMVIYLKIISSMVNINKQESSAINSVRFFCILTIVMVHCSLHDSTSLEPLLCKEYMPATIRWYAILSFGEVALRIFFVLSGYLFFRDVTDSFCWKKDYLNKLKSRLSSLLILYLVWTTIGLAYQLALGKVQNLDVLTVLSGYWPVSEDAVLWDRGLWFIRTLILFAVLSPLYYVIVKYLKHCTLIVCLLFYLTNVRIDFPYFNMWLLIGAYLAYMGITLTRLSQLLDFKLALVCVMVLQFVIRPDFVVLKTDLALAVVLYFCIFMRFFLRHPLPSRVVASCTFVYVGHFYLVGIFKNIFARILPHSVMGYVANMCLTWFFSAVICVLAYMLVVSRYRVLKLIFVGGRGVKKSPKNQLPAS